MSKTPKNPPNDIKTLALSKKISKSDKYFTQDWTRRILEAVDNTRDKTYLLYHIETGLRVSDVLDTEVVHIDWQNNRTYTYDHKKDAWRWIYFPQRVHSQLLIWMKTRQLADIKSPRLFPFTDKTANRIVKKWAAHVQHPYAHAVGSHWCRHTFIRLSRSAGRDIKAVQQNTGDRIKTILEWYADLNSEDMHKEVEGKPIF